MFEPGQTARRWANAVLGYLGATLRPNRRSWTVRLRPLFQELGVWCIILTAWLMEEAMRELVILATLVVGAGLNLLWG